jgi:hypothetical protein
VSTRETPLDFETVAREALAQAEHLRQRHKLKQHLGDLQALWAMEDGKPLPAVEPPGVTVAPQHEHFPGNRNP